MEQAFRPLITMHAVCVHGVEQAFRPLITKHAIWVHGVQQAFMPLITQACYLGSRSGAGIYACG